MSFFVYIDLSSPQNESSSPVNPSSSKDSSLPQPKHRSEVKKNPKKTRNQHFIEESPEKGEDIGEQRVLKKVKKEIPKEKHEKPMEIERKKEMTPEKTPERQSIRLKKVSDKEKEKAKHHKHDKHDQPKLASTMSVNGKKQNMPSIEKLSIDDYIKRIEKELNLKEFVDKTEGYQKDLNLLEENIQENKILEELKDDKTKENTQNIIVPNLEVEKAIQEAPKKHQEALESKKNSSNIEMNEETIMNLVDSCDIQADVVKEKPIDSEKKHQQVVEEKHKGTPLIGKKNIQENREASIQKEKNVKSSSSLLQETIEEIKKLKKQQIQQKVTSKQPLASSLYKDLKSFLLSPSRHPVQPQNKLLEFPKNTSTMKPKLLYTTLRDIYQDFRKYELKDHEYTCDVCMGKESDDNNLILICDLCDGAVHQSCYGSELIRFLPEGNWYCNRCKFIIQNELDYKSVRCIFCPEFKGIIKRINGNEQLWGHVSCVLNIHGVSYLDKKDRETVSLEEFFSNPSKNECNGCGIEYGACLKCENKDCEKFYHVSCAMRRGFIYRESGKFHVACKGHQGELARKVKDALSKRHSEYRKNPEKYSLMLEKEEYLWLVMRKGSETIEGKSKSGNEEKDDEGVSNDFFINLNEDDDFKEEQELKNKNKTPNVKLQPTKTMEIEETQEKIQGIEKGVGAKASAFKKQTLSSKPVGESNNLSKKSPEKIKENEPEEEEEKKQAFEIKDIDIYLNLNNENINENLSSNGDDDRRKTNVPLKNINFETFSEGMKTVQVAKNEGVPRSSHDFIETLSKKLGNTPSKIIVHEETNNQPSKPLDFHSETTQNKFHKEQQNLGQNFVVNIDDNSSKENHGSNKKTTNSPMKDNNQALEHPKESPIENEAKEPSPKKITPQKISLSPNKATPQKKIESSKKLLESPGKLLDSPKKPAKTTQNPFELTENSQIQIKKPMEPTINFMQHQTTTPLKNIMETEKMLETKHMTESSQKSMSLGISQNMLSSPPPQEIKNHVESSHILTVQSPQKVNKPLEKQNAIDSFSHPTEISIVQSPHKINIPLQNQTSLESSSHPLSHPNKTNENIECNIKQDTNTQKPTTYEEQKNPTSVQINQEHTKPAESRENPYDSGLNVIDILSKTLEKTTIVQPIFQENQRNSQIIEENRDKTNEKEEIQAKKQIILIDSMDIEEEPGKPAVFISAENGEPKSGFLLNPDRPKLYRDLMAILSESKMEL